jgi:Tol biopolymer transport system component
MLDPSADGPERLTDDEWDEISPSVSADGRYLMFLRGSFADDIPLTYHLLDLDCHPDCEPTPLADEVNELADLRWSPVAPVLVGWGKDNALWLVDVEENTVEILIGGKWNAYPAWSPDGEMIVVSSDVVPPESMLSDDIQVIPAQLGVGASDRINLTYSGLFTEEVRPSFSPDGAYIAYLTQNIMGDEADPFYDNPNALITIEANCIDDAPDACLDSRQLMSEDEHTVIDYVWSPDSQYIAYLVGFPFDPENRNGDLYVVEIESGDVEQITEDQTTGVFTWAPNSTAIVYERITETSYDVYMASPTNDFKPGAVLDGFRASATPYWSPRH